MYNPVSDQLPGRKIFYGYYIVLAAFIIQIAMLGPRASYGVFFKPMSNELDWARALTAGAFSVSQLIQGISGVFMGGLNDKFGPRLVLTLCGLLIGSGVMLMSTIHSAWELYLYYSLIVGVGMGGLVAPPFSTVARWFVKRRSVMTGFIVAGGGSGMLIMPLLAGWLMAAGWRNALLILGAVIMGVTVIASQFLKKDPAQMGLRAYGSDEVKSDKKQPVAGLTVKEAVRTRQFWMLLVMMFAFGAGGSTMMVHYVPYITDRGISSTMAAVIFSALGASVVAGSVILGAFANKVGNRQSSMVSFAILSAGLFALLIQENWLLYVLPFAFGMAYGGLTPLQSTLAAELFGMKAHGLLLGICSFGLLIGASIGPFTAGYVFDTYGSYSRAFLILGIVAAVGFVFAVMLRKPEKPAAGR